MKLRVKEIDPQTIRDGEQLFFDTVQSSDALSEKMLEPLCASVSANDESISRDALTNSLVNTVRRKSLLCPYVTSCYRSARPST